MSGRFRRHWRHLDELSAGLQSRDALSSCHLMELRWLQGLFEATGSPAGMVRGLGTLQEAEEDLAFQQRKVLSFCQIALQRLSISLRAGAHDRLRELVVEARTKAIVLLDDATTSEIREAFCSMLFTRGVTLRQLRGLIEELLLRVQRVRPDRPRILDPASGP